jgi:hypothetical protein
VEKASLPKTEEEDSEEDGQQPDTDLLGLLEDLDQAVCESSDPEEPFEQSSKHDTSDNGNVDNLRLLDRGGGAAGGETYILDGPWVSDVGNAFTVDSGHEGPDDGAGLVPHCEVLKASRRCESREGEAQRGSGGGKVVPSWWRGVRVTRRTLAGCVVARR